MTLRHVPVRSMAVGFALALWMGASAADADAQTRREGKWQFNIPITFTFSQTIDGQGESSVDLRLGFWLRVPSE